MKENIMSKQSKTDWDRIDAMSDEDIDTSEIPPLDDDFFANAELRIPERKIPITVCIDPDILVWYRSLGKGYQTRINSVLRMYMEAHQNR